MSPLLVIGVIQVVAAHYCDTPECPEFTFMKSLRIKEVRPHFIELVWEPKENYSIERYEVHWYSESDCIECENQVSLLNTSVKVIVQPCTVYTIEVYGFNGNFNKTAPAIVTKVTAPNSLMNGTAVLVGDTWAVIRWLKISKCPKSIHIAVCNGLSIMVEIKPFDGDDVVIFRFASLTENSTYLCVAYTLNSAGSSTPSLPVSFQTSGIINTERTNNENIMAIMAVVFLVILAMISMIFLLNKKGLLKLPWRRSYTVNETTT